MTDDHKAYLIRKGFDDARLRADLTLSDSMQIDRAAAILVPLINATLARLYDAIQNAGG